jgi:hypothetical protein
MSPIIVRLRECGLTSPRNRFRALLNLRSVLLKREIDDRNLKHDERIAPRNEAYECWFAADRAYHTPTTPRETRDRCDALYFDALMRLREAKERRERRIERLTAMRSAVKAALRRGV